MKRLISLFVFIAIIISLSSCGYNKKMYGHLSDPDNYEQYNVKLANIRYEYEEDGVSESFDSDRIDEVKNVFLDVTLKSKEDIAPFLGVSKDSLNKECDEYAIRLTIIPENVKILYEKGFFDDCKIGDYIILSVSNWIYQDTEFFYVASITYNNIEYLSKTDGLENIKKMMKNNKGL